MQCKVAKQFKDVNGETRKRGDTIEVSRERFSQLLRNRMVGIYREDARKPQPETPEQPKSHKTPKQPKGAETTDKKPDETRGKEKLPSSQQSLPLTPEP